jgi:MFS family permease
MAAMLLSDCEKPSRVHYEVLLMTSAGWLFDFYDLVLYTFLLSPINRDLHLPGVELSYAAVAIGTPLAASAVGGVIFGALSDRFGRKGSLQWTIIVYSAGTLLTGLAWDLPSLLVFRAITGLGVGGEWAVGQTYVSEVFPPSIRGRFGAFMQASAPLGVALAALVGGFVAPYVGWRVCFFLSALPALLVVGIRRRLPESDLWLQRRKLHAQGPTAAREVWEKFSRLFSREHRKWFTFALILATFDMTAYWLTFAWLPRYLNAERHLTITQSALWIVWTQVGILAGCATFGFVSDRFGRRPAYTIYCGLMAAGLVMITLFWDVLAASPSVILAFMFLVGFGTGNFGGYGPLFSELFPTTVRNTALGAAFNIARGLQFFSPIIIAVIAREHGLEKGIALASVFALLTGAWIWVFPETRGWSLDSSKVKSA